MAARCRQTAALAAAGRALPRSVARRFPALRTCFVAKTTFGPQVSGCARDGLLIVVLQLLVLYFRRPVSLGRTAKGTRRLRRERAASVKDGSRGWWCVRRPRRVSTKNSNSSAEAARASAHAARSSASCCGLGAAYLFTTRVATLTSAAFYCWEHVCDHTTAECNKNCCRWGPCQKHH